MFGGLSQRVIYRAIAATLCSAFLLSAFGCAVFKAKSTRNDKLESQQQPVHLIEPKLGHARTYFRRHDYRAALIALGNKIDDREARLIAAESNYRLGRYDEAKLHFEEILKGAEDQIERRKVLIRLFEIELRTNDIQSAVNRYVAFGKEFKKTTSQMRYGLGKALFDVGYFERAEKVLKGVPKDSEFYMRASYILASLGLENKSPAASIKAFNQIEVLEPVSVEDHAVRQLAILAQGRIYADAGKEDLALKAYGRVSLAGEFGETATLESVRTMLARASQARLGTGRFQKVSAFRRQLIESESIKSALGEVERYRKAYEIDWRKPELLTVMANLYVETRRYDDARLAYQELIGHYRQIYDSLVASDADTEVWPFFSLDFDRDEKTLRTISMIDGVPDSLLSELSEVQEILALRSRIEESEKRLRDMEERAENFGAKNAPATLAKTRARQAGIATAYNGMVIKKQNGFKKSVAKILNRSLAEAEFKRADLVVREMQDLKKQQGVVHDFQSEKIDTFEDYLNELDAGGSS